MSIKFSTYRQNLSGFLQGECWASADLQTTVSVDMKFIASLTL